MFRNAYRALRDLLPEAPPLFVGQVVANSGGLATIEVPGGGTLQARGSAAVGDRVFFRDGVIESEAPDLPTLVIEI